MPRHSFFGVVLAGILPAAAAADVVHLSTGGKIVGAVVEGESSESKLVVRTKTGRMVLPRSQVDRIERSDGPAAESYKDVVRRYGDSAEEQFDLAKWCLDNGYKKEAVEHFRKVLSHDSNHPGAREKLGYKRVDGEWKTEDEIKTSLGLVKDGKGKWVLPQQKEESEKKATAVKARSELFSKIRTWQRQIHGETALKADSAMQQLRALKDPSAVEPLMKYLWDKQAPAGDRQLLIEILAKISHDDSTKALEKIALEDERQEVRLAAVEAIKPRKTPALIKAIAKFLKHKENRIVNAAADVLAEIGDFTVVPALADALITTHQYEHYTTWDEVRQATTPQPFTTQRTIVTADGKMVRIPQNPQVASGGMVGEALPPVRLIKETKQNESVREALGKLTGQDFGFEKARWLDWVRVHSNEKAGKVLGR